MALKDQGNLKDAIPLYQQTLASGIKTYGEDHPTVARGRNNLAMALQDQGNLDEVKWDGRGNLVEDPAAEVNESSLAQLSSGPTLFNKRSHKASFKPMQLENERQLNEEKEKAGCRCHCVIL